MKTNIKLFNFYIAVAALLFTACSDQFLQDVDDLFFCPVSVDHHLDARRHTFKYSKCKLWR